MSTTSERMLLRVVSSCVAWSRVTGEPLPELRCWSLIAAAVESAAPELPRSLDSCSPRTSTP